MPGKGPALLHHRGQGQSTKDREKVEGRLPGEAQAPGPHRRDRRRRAVCFSGDGGHADPGRLGKVRNHALFDEGMVSDHDGQRPGGPACGGRPGGGLFGGAVPADHLPYSPQGDGSFLRL